MTQKREEWMFVQLRAAQLFEEGKVRQALRLMKTLNQEQQLIFERRMAANMNESKIVSTQH